MSGSISATCRAVSACRALIGVAKPAVSSASPAMAAAITAMTRMTSPLSTRSLTTVLPSPTPGDVYLQNITKVLGFALNQGIMELPETAVGEILTISNLSELLRNWMKGKIVLDESQVYTLLSELIKKKGEEAPWGLIPIGPKGKSLLHGVIEAGYPSCAALLLNQGYPTEIRDDDGRTPLNLAAKADSLEMIKVLLKAGAHVNTKDDDGDTPLHWAAHLRSDRVVCALMDAGADPCVKQGENKTPLDLYARALIVPNFRGEPSFLSFYNDETLERLLFATVRLVRNPKNGITPLHAAARYGNYLLVQILFVHYKQRIGYPKEIACGKKDSEGKTPFDYAKEAGHEDIIPILDPTRDIGIGDPYGIRYPK